ncbi:MAG: IS3 family transposase [Synergistaceae bacterium]|nr:IS3 family transposase [Synergistaceae bacterium]
MTDSKKARGEGYVNLVRGRVIERPFQWSESFFANLKKEAVHWTQFKTKEEARQTMFAYIEGFYNTKRVQKRPGYLSPTQWLEKWLGNHSVEAA